MSVAKRTTAIVIAFACAAAFCLVLGACGGNSSPFVGHWYTYELVQNGQTINYDTADADMKAKMDASNIDIKADGTARLEDAGQTADGTWEATGNTTGTLNVNDLTFTLSVEGDKLTVVNPFGATLTMQKR